MRALIAHIPMAGWLATVHAPDTVAFHCYRDNQRFFAVTVSREAVTKTVDRRRQEWTLTPSEGTLTPSKRVKAPSLATAAHRCHHIL